MFSLVRGWRGNKMFTDYIYHVFGKQNTAHLTLQFEMSAVIIKKNKFWKVMEHVVTVAWWTIMNLQVMLPTRSLTYVRIAAGLDYMPDLLCANLSPKNLSIKHLHVNNVCYNAKTNMTVLTKPCHFSNLNKSKSAPSYL